MSPSLPSNTAGSTSKAEQAYQAVQSKIASGEYGPGYRLVLGRIAADLGCSAVPVREAIRRLEAEGLVRYTLNIGAEVVGVNAADYTETMQVLAQLEGLATALAAQVMDEQTLERAREINERMRELRSSGFDPVQFTSLNHEFHVVLCSVCPNHHLLDLLGREWERMAQIRSSTFSHVPDRSRTSVEEHDQLLELIGGQAPQGMIEELARRHKLCTLRQFLDSEGSRS